MNASWVALGMGIAIAVVFAASWLRRGHDLDLGTVSPQWIAEQRTHHAHDQQR